MFEFHVESAEWVFMQRSLTHLVPCGLNLKTMCWDKPTFMSSVFFLLLLLLWQSITRSVNMISLPRIIVIHWKHLFFIFKMNFMSTFTRLVWGQLWAILRRQHIKTIKKTPRKKGLQTQIHKNSTGFKWYQSYLWLSCEGEKWQQRVTDGLDWLDCRKHAGRTGKCFTPSVKLMADLQTGI